MLLISLRLFPSGPAINSQHDSSIVSLLLAQVHFYEEDEGN